MSYEFSLPPQHDASHVCFEFLNFKTLVAKSDLIALFQVQTIFEGESRFIFQIIFKHFDFCSASNKRVCIVTASILALASSTIRLANSSFSVALSSSSLLFASF